MKIGSKNERDLEIDVGLHVLASHVKPGERVPDRTIGYVCGRSHGWVCMMNRKLMRKVRERLRRAIADSQSQIAQ